MLKIAVVDDSGMDAANLNEYLTRYGRENKIDMDVDVFTSGVAFLQSGKRHAISRPRKAEFMQQIADYFVGRKVSTGRS